MQPTTHSNSLDNPSGDFIPIAERKWIDIPANEHCTGDTLESRLSTLIMKLVRHLDQKERESDGAVHWKSMGPKLRHAFQTGGGHTISETGWINRIWKGSNKTRFQQCKKSCDALLYICALQGHTGGGRDRARAAGPCRCSTQMEGIPVSRRMLL